MQSCRKSQNVTDSRGGGPGRNIVAALVAPVVFKVPPPGSTSDGAKMIWEISDVCLLRLLGYQNLRITDGNADLRSLF